MIRRLTEFDLPGRLRRRRVPGHVAGALAGVGLAAVAVVARVLIELVVPGVSPFVLLFPAVLLATVIAGWTGGVTAVATGTVLSWYFVLPPYWSWELNPGRGVSLALEVLASGFVVAVAAGYRTAALALHDSEERMALATEVAHLGVWERRIDTRQVTYSSEAKRICGFQLDKPVTWEMAQDLVHPEDLPIAIERFSRAIDPAIRDMSPLEYRIVRPDGEVRWVYAQGLIFFEPDQSGRLVPTRNVGVIQDITARKLNEERLRLLAREVDHRANNLLAVVQGTVALSQADDPAALKRVITGRVNALARAHQLLSQARWEGADLRRLVEEELLAFSLGDDARVSVRGPAVALAPAAAQAVAMALHELATNAAKYGALSASAGRVEVSWTRNREALRINWRETGGPKVAEPTRKGLGTTLLARALAGPIGGGAALDWRPEGLACELTLPAAALENAAGAAEGALMMDAVEEPKAQPAR